MNPQLERILKHELTHSFLRSLAGGRCPTWLNEGMAELMEPRSSDTYAKPLAALFQQRREISFSVLEHPSSAFPTCRHRLHTQSLCPEWSTCATDTAWLKS